VSWSLTTSPCARGFRLHEERGYVRMKRSVMPTRAKAVRADARDMVRLILVME